MFKHPFLATFLHDSPLSLTARFIGGEERRNLLAWTRMRGAIPHSTNETWNMYIYIYIHNYIHINFVDVLKVPMDCMGLLKHNKTTNAL